MESIEKIFKIRLQKSNLNTSYPLYPLDWEKFRVFEKLQFSKNEELSFYIHIPFCNNLCTFCEYTRMKCPDEILQNYYLDILESDIQKFLSQYPYIILQGFDIGGGTPTSLNERSFERLMNIYQKVISTVEISHDFESSIEGSFPTLSETKIKLISDAGIKRISLGVQTTNKLVLSANSRSKLSVEKMFRWIKFAKSVGIKKINLDFMYGIKSQSLKEIHSDIELINQFKVEQITLYELRTNMIAGQTNMSKEKLYLCYNSFYKGLTSLQYESRFGQNTFSIDRFDFGVSSYLRSRMLKGGSYKGFGLSAQSMNKFGLSYNIGKNNTNLLDYIKRSTYDEEYTYKLSRREILSKYIAISAYYGGFSLRIASEILGSDSFQYFKPQIDFCKEKELMTLEHDNLLITPKGYENYGAVFSLFYIVNLQKHD